MDVSLVRATPELAFSAKGSLLLYLILSQSKSSRDTFANGPAYFVCEMTHLAANGSRSGWQPYRFSKALLPVRLRLDIFLNQNHRAIIDMSAMRPIVTQRKDEHSIINLMVQSKALR